MNTDKPASLRGRVFSCMPHTQSTPTACWLMALLLFCLPAMTRAHAQDTGNALYEKLQTACPEILVEGRLQGSGFVATPEGYVITASHVVWPGDKPVEVLIHQIGRLKAEVVAVDRGHDLALLKLPTTNTPYAHLPLIQTDVFPQVLDELYLFGVPIFRHHVLIPGRVARAKPTFEYLPEGPFYTRVLHIAADAPRGMSGGPWVNADGRVVAVQTGYMSQKGVPLGLSFASPIDAVRRLVQTGISARTPTLKAAFEELWEQPKEAIARWPAQSMGVLAVEVQPGGPAAEAGLSARKLIVSAGGQAIATRQQLLETLRKQKPGSVITMTVLSTSGRAETLRVPLALLEKAFAGTSTAVVRP